MPLMTADKSRSGRMGAVASYDMPDQTGRTVVITGASSGLGLAATKAFASKGARVVMACRDLGRGDQARQTVLDEQPSASVALRRLDLADLSSIRAFVDNLADRRVDVLLNNAGIMAVPQATTKDNFELQWGTNHLGHFALTGLLLPRLSDAQVVTVSSSLHRAALGDASVEPRRYNKWTAYARSKLANLLFTYELDRRARAAGVALRSAAAHPGYADTNLQSGLLRHGNRFFARPPGHNVMPILFAATAPQVQGGEFYAPPTKRVFSSKQSYDVALAGRVWAVSEAATGVRYAWSR